MEPVPVYCPHRLHVVTDSGVIVVSETSSPREHATAARDILVALRHLQARGDSDSAQATMLRVLWLRSEHENARIETELTHLRDDLVVFHATVTLANGASASGYAAEPLTMDDEPAVTIERGETRAIGRALDILGYIVSPEMPASVSDQTPRPVAAEPRTPPTSTPQDPAASGSPPMVVNALRNVSLRRRGSETLPGAGIDPDTGEVIGPVRTSEPPGRMPSASSLDVAASATTGDLPLEDYTWTHFWRWARAHDLANKAQVEQRLGHSIDGRTPAEVRAELQQHGVPL